MSTSIEGRIAVDVSFADKSEASGVQSLKKISLTDTQAYTSGKVAIVSGTVGVSEVFINVSDLSYRNAAGVLVSFTSITRAAMKSSSDLLLSHSGSTILFSRSNVSVSDVASLSGTLTLQSPGPTATYTLVLYGT